MSRGQIIGFSIGMVLVMAFGLCWVIVGRRGCRDLERLRQTGYRATGVVIDYKYERDSGGGTVPYPVVRFPGCGPCRIRPRSAAIRGYGARLSGEVQVSGAPLAREAPSA